jgi:hypothetical protein
MTGRRIYGIVFLLSFAFLVLSVSWLVFHIATGGIDLIFTEIVDQIILIVGFLSFLIALSSIHKLLEDIRYEINEIKEIEKNVRDFYRYEQLMNPSDMDN